MLKDNIIGLFTEQQEKGLIKFIKKTVKRVKNKDSHYIVMTPKQFKIIMKHAKPYKPICPTNPSPLRK